MLARNARVLVMPSRYREPFGLVALEAIMSGIPVAVSSHALLAEELKAKGYGVAIDPHNEGEFAAALASLAVDDARISAMSRKGYETGRSMAPTLSDWADRLVELYEDVLAESTVSGPHSSVLQPAAEALT